MKTRNTKVIVTIGPATCSKESIKKLFEMGADAFRLNMSHLSHKDAATLCGYIREIEDETGSNIGILVDLQGPKIRLGEVEPGAFLTKGAPFELVSDPLIGNAERAQLPHPEFFRVVEVSQHILIDDGRIRLCVTGKFDGRVATRVVCGGALSGRKGVNLPETVLPVSSMTAKDVEDLNCALDNNIDWVALSFVQRARDISEIKQIVNGRCCVMAKIEKPQVLKDISAVVAEADGVMIARGDLGVELPVEKVPSIQKEVTLAARQAGKPVVIATQMLESMVQSPVPTRAEVSDVAQAVFEGADAVMLSSETASGAYPFEAVSVMGRIAQEVESSELYRKIFHPVEPTSDRTDALCLACYQITDLIDVAAVVCYTNSGQTGLTMAKWRPRPPILALTHIRETARRLALVWGIHPVRTTDPEDLEDVICKACSIAVQAGKAKKGDTIAVMAGIPIGTPGATNLLRIVQI